MSSNWLKILHTTSIEKLACNNAKHELLQSSKLTGTSIPETIITVLFREN